MFDQSLKNYILLIKINHQFFSNNQVIYWVKDSHCYALLVEVKTSILS
jgi:hypothetical protein